MVEEVRHIRRQILPNGLTVGGDKVLVMAGPCSVESREQLFSTAEQISAAGARVLRGGAWIGALESKDALKRLYGRAERDEADIVEWYETRPVTVSTPIAAGAIIGAFTLGVLTAVGALALMGRLDD